MVLAGPLLLGRSTCALHCRPCHRQHKLAARLAVVCESSGERHNGVVITGGTRGLGYVHPFRQNMSTRHIVVQLRLTTVQLGTKYTAENTYHRNTS
jgi:hypothetical protein